MRSEVCFHTRNPQSHLKPACHQRATGQHKCCPTRPGFIIGFSEASGHHSLCFLRAECKGVYEIKNYHPEGLI